MQLSRAQDGDCSAGARRALAANWEWGDGGRDTHTLLFSTAAALFHVKRQLSKCVFIDGHGVYQRNLVTRPCSHPGWQKMALFWTQPPLKGRAAVSFEAEFTDDV